MDIGHGVLQTFCPKTKRYEKGIAIDFIISNIFTVILQVSRADMIALQTDFHSGLADDFLPFLTSLRFGGDEDTCSIRDALQKWDRRMTVGSVEATVFQRW